MSNMLPTIVENQPQAAYSAFASDFKRVKLHHENHSWYQWIASTNWRHHSKLFLTAITGARVCSEEKRKIFSLSTRNGGLTVSIFLHEQGEVSTVTPKE